MKNREQAEIEAAGLFQEELDQIIEKASRTYKNKTKQAMTDCKQKVMDAWKNSQELDGNTNVVCEESIDKAMQAREKSESEALLSYRQEVDKAIEKASQVYKERINKALFECKQKIKDAWENSRETSVLMTGVIEDDQILNPGKPHSGVKMEHQKTDVNNSLLRLKANVITTFHKVRKELVEKPAED